MKPEAMFPNHTTLDLPFIIHAIGVSQPQCRRTREEGSAVAQIIYGVEGEGRLNVDGRTYEIGPGICFYLPAGVPHDYWPTGDHWETSWLCFDGLHLKETLEGMGLQKACVTTLPDPTRFDALFHNIFTELRTDAINGQLRASPYVYRIVAEFILLRREQQTQQSQRTSKLKPVLDYIDVHLDKVITLEELSDLVSLTPQHFCRVFKEGVGERPFQYILKRRIQVAKRLLLETNERISDIGKKVGMENSSYFCYNFKRLEEMTPSEFRSMYAS